LYETVCLVRSPLGEEIESGNATDATLARGAAFVGRDGIDEDAPHGARFDHGDCVETCERLWR
jgi:hypothetical protein